MGLQLKSVEKPIWWICIYKMGSHLNGVEKPIKTKALSPYLLKVDRYQGLRLCLYPNNTHSPLKTSHAKG